MGTHSYRVCRLLFLLSVLCLPSLLQAGTREIIIPDRTPTDVYHRVLELEQRVIQLRDEQDIFDAWPRTIDGAEALTRSPRHVLQKSIEVLEKINRLRGIRGQGAITIARYPSRYITPNDVYDSVDRLVPEVEFLLQTRPQSAGISVNPDQRRGYTPSDVYRKLWEISLALDPLIGVHGFSPSDVYARARYVAELIRFLRLSQNLPDNIPLPERQNGRHPNHALQAAYDLLARISQAERNLWMQPEQVPEVPRRVIRPTEVYDALQVVIAELQRIKYRLGVERELPLPDVEPGKSPADVEQVLIWAAQAMPQFEPQRPLLQYDQASLLRQPADVLQVASHIYRGLRHYQQQRGIRQQPQQSSLTQGLEPRHVYQKTLVNLDKVVRLREQVGLGVTAVPVYPLRAITPSEVYELAIRLRDELELVYHSTGITAVPEPQIMPVYSIQQQVTPSDVYRQMWDVSLLLDVVLGPAGYSIKDLYLAAVNVNRELKLLAQHLHRWHPLELPVLKEGVDAEQVLLAARGLLDLTEQAQQRAGLVGGQVPQPVITKRPDIGELFNTMGVISTELVALKLQLGVTQQVVKSQVVKSAVTPENAVPGVTPAEPGVTLAQVEQQLRYGQRLIRTRLLEDQ
ncbi:MAG: hypothetical protein OIF57_16710 [Marinobacterium sp.]|nr:hypothetical protein [Marinobacterium sp.]